MLSVISYLIKLGLSAVAGKFFTKLIVDAILLILFNNYKSISSNKIVVILNMGFWGLHEIETIVSQLVILYSSYQTLELINVEFVCT